MPWNASDPRLIDEALAVLRQGHLLVLPTDTVYGIAADPCSPGAEQRLYQAKNRPPDKPIPLLVANEAQIEQRQARFGPEARTLARRYWPGALTMILPVDRRPASPGISTTHDPCRQDSPDAEIHNRKDISHWEGFRIPDHAVTLTLLRAAGGALRVTSANRSGAPPALTAHDAVKALGSSIDLVLDAGRTQGGSPSTVIQITESTLIILREGAIPGRDIFEVYRSATRHPLN